MKAEVKRLPELFLERLRRLIPVQKFDEIANTFAESKPTTFRVNTLKASPEILRERLEHQGFRLEKVAWYPQAFILHSGRLRELQDTETYKKGEILANDSNKIRFFKLKANLEIQGVTDP